MKIKLAVLAILLCSLTCTSFGQTPADSTVIQSSTTSKELKIDGIWELTGYLGKKLGRQFSDRLNLEDNAPDQTPKPVKVTIVLGPFRIERTDSR